MERAVIGIAAIIQHCTIRTAITMVEIVNVINESSINGSKVIHIIRGIEVGATICC